MKPAYSYYTDKMWRFFIPRYKQYRENGIQPDFRNEVERGNYALCGIVWSGLSSTEKDTLAVIYCTPREELEEAVRRFAAEHALSVQAAWSISHRTGRQLAIRKGLIAEEHPPAFPGNTTEADRIDT